MISKVTKSLLYTSQAFVKLELRAAALNLQSNSRYFFSQNVSALNEDTISFPREGEGLNYKLNWELARAMVTPYSHVAHNTTKSGSAGGSKTQVVSKGKEVNAAQYTELHRKIAKQLSKGEKVFVEEGELGGLHVRIVSSSADAAGNARAVLKEVNAKDFKGNVTVLVGNVEGLKDTIVDKEKRTVLTPSAHKDTLEEAVRQFVAEQK
mmetsp:Transcript_48000/g.55512  ORF Transcript_48000/g.55512 Transcript_48000/m.55512 type:complete len:208 (+) Transcript_48000:66-689(+)